MTDDVRTAELATPGSTPPSPADTVAGETVAGQAGEAAVCVIDGGELACVQLLLLLRSHILRLPAGTVVHLSTGYAIAEIDVPAWCHLTGHEWLGRLPGAAEPTYAIRVCGTATPTDPQRPWRLLAEPSPEEATR